MTSAPSPKPEDPRQTYAARLAECPVHRQGDMVVVYGQPEVVSVVTQPELFSSQVSRFLQLPNGLDGEEHRRFRALIDPYLSSPDALVLVEEIAREVMRDLTADLTLPTTIEAVGELGAVYAVRVQLRWLGWRPELEDQLLNWIADNRAASRSGDHAWNARVAEEFDGIIRAELQRRRVQPSPDVTTRLMNDMSLGRPLRDEELVSILRNWTAGDLASLALCVGVVLHGLATHPQVQERLRAGVPDEEFDSVLDELLRLDDPFVANRRKASADTVIGGVPVSAGTVVQVNWTAANLDPRAFDDPHSFGPEAHAPRNLVYGTGPHACPGRLLSTLELRVLTRELLGFTRRIVLGGQTERELPPGGGYARVTLRLE